MKARRAARTGSPSGELPGRRLIATFAHPGNGVPF